MPIFTALATDRRRCAKCHTLKTLHSYPGYQCPEQWRPTTEREAIRELERAEQSGDAERVFVARGDVQRLRAFARNSDPETSHAAARSLSSDALTVAQKIVLQILRDSGPMTDEQLVEHPVVQRYLSPSGARSRRSELVHSGYVVAMPEQRLTRSGRRAIVWGYRERTS